jgi:hypothetical protein
MGGSKNILFGGGREYELITEAHAKLSVVRNCSKSSLHVCLGEGKQLAGGGWSAVTGGGGGGADSTQGRESGAVSNDRKLSVGFCY